MSWLWNWILDRVKGEPAMLMALLVAVLHVVAGQTGLSPNIKAIIDALLALLGGAVVRSQVTPV